MTTKKDKQPNLKRIDKESFEEEVTYIDDKDVEIIFENEEKINRKFKKKGPIKKYIDIVKNLFGMLRDYKNGAYRGVPWSTIASIVLGLLYVLNPVDILPDFIPGIGYIDDAGVVALLLKMIKSDFQAYLEWKKISEEKR